MLFERLRRQVRWIIIGVAAAVAITLAYVGGPAFFSGGDEADPTIARVNGQSIAQSDFQRAYANQVRAYERSQGFVRPTDLEELRYQALNGLITGRLLAQAARDEGIRVSRREVEERLGVIRDAFPGEAEFRRELERSGLTEADLRRAMEENLMVEKLQEKLVGDVPVSDEEMARAYEQVALRQILVRPRGSSEEAWKQAEARAERLHRRLQQGADFVDLARAESDDEASRDQGGELGFVGRGALPEALERAAFALKPGEMARPVRTDFGYHILQVTERRDPTGEAFEQARPELARQLRLEKANDRFLQWLADLRRGASVEIVDVPMAARDALGRGELEQALRLYRQALELNPEDAYLHYGVARVLNALNRPGEAVKALEKAVELESGDPVLQLELGNLYRQEGRAEKAAAALRKASELSPMDPQMHLTLFALFQVMGLERDATRERQQLEQIQQAMEEQQRLQEEFVRRLQEQRRQTGSGASEAEGQPPAQPSRPEAEGGRPGTAPPGSGTSGTSGK